jgi:hypothetical protein
MPVSESPEAPSPPRHSEPPLPVRHRQTGEDPQLRESESDGVHSESQCQHLPVARAGPGGLPAGPLGASWGCNLDPDSDTEVTGRLRLTSGLLGLFGLGHVLARQPASGHITRPKSETTGMRVNLKESQLEDSFSRQPLRYRRV